MDHLHDRGEEHPAPRPDAGTVRLLVDLRGDAETRAEAQQYAADNVGLRNRILTYGAAVLAGLGGTSAFVSLAQSTDPRLVLAAAVFSAVAAAASALQGAGRFGVREGEHRKWAAKASELARNIEFVEANPGGPELTAKRFERFNADLSAFDESAPNVPPGIYRRAKETVLARAARQQVP